MPEADQTPFVVGFRTVIRDPRLFLAELGWRWCLGAIALVICSFALRGAFHAVQISPLQITNLRSENAFVALEALKEIIERVLPSLFRSFLSVVPILAILWLFFATAGRCLTFRLLQADSTPNWGATFLLHLVRVLWALLVCATLFGAIVLTAAFVARGDPDYPNYPLYFVLVGLIGLVMMLLANVGNWYLSLAPLFSVVRGQSTLRAMDSSRKLSKSFAGALSTTTMMFLFVRLIWFGAVGVLSMAPVALFQNSVGLGVVLTLLLTLLYSAGASLLYIARMAGYWRIIGQPSQEPPPLLNH